MDVELSYITALPATSDWSIPVTFICANFPNPPPIPTLVLASIPLVIVDGSLLLQMEAPPFLDTPST